METTTATKYTYLHDSIKKKISVDKIESIDYLVSSDCLILKLHRFLSAEREICRMKQLKKIFGCNDQLCLVFVLNLSEEQKEKLKTNIVVSEETKADIRKLIADLKVRGLI